MRIFIKITKKRIKGLQYIANKTLNNFMVKIKKFSLVVFLTAFCFLAVKIVSAQSAQTENSFSKDTSSRAGVEEVEDVRQTEPQKGIGTQAEKCSFPELEKKIAEIEQAIAEEEGKGNIEKAEDLLSMVRELKKELEEKKTKCKEEEEVRTLERNLKKLEENLKKAEEKSQTKSLEEDKEKIEEIIKKIGKVKETAEETGPSWFESKWEEGVAKEARRIKAARDLKESKCIVPDSLLRELDELMRKVEIAKEKKDIELEKEINQKIADLKKRIEKKKEDCEEKVQISPSNTQERTPEKMPLSETPAYAVLCEEAKKELKEIEKEITSYEELLSSLTSKKLEESVEMLFGVDKGELVKTIENLKNKRTKILSIIAECEGSKEPESERIILEKVEPPKNDKEISAYYRKKIAGIMKKDVPVDEQIKQLKKVKEDINKMIEKLIKTKKKFSIEEIRPITGKSIKIEPGVIKTGKTEVQSQEEKEIDISLKNKPVKLRVSPKSLFLEQEGVNVDVKAPVEIGAKDITLGGKGIKLTPKEALSVVKAGKPVKIELAKEGGKPVYKVKTVERKRIFFIFPVSVKKEILIDAANPQGSKIKERKPWWSFLAW